MTKTLQWVEREYNIIKAIYDKLPANIILNDEKLKTSSKIRSKTRMPNLATFIQHSIESLSNTLKPKKKKKIEEIQTGKEEVKLSVFADNTILYRENPKYTTKKILELINEFGKVTGYTSNIQKSVAFLNTNNCQKEDLRKWQPTPIFLPGESMDRGA